MDGTNKKLAHTCTAPCAHKQEIGPHPPPPPPFFLGGGGGGGGGGGKLGPCSGPPPECDSLLSFPRLACFLLFFSQEGNRFLTLSLLCFNFFLTFSLHA